MPIYEYVCSDCGEIFEKMVRFSEADRSPACTKCAGLDTHKKISKVGAFGTSFLGSSSPASSSCGSQGGFS